MTAHVIRAAGHYYDFLAAIYNYREYLKHSVIRDLRKKYKRSTLGYLWSMLNPLLLMIVLTMVFSKIMSHVETYSVFLFSSLLAWQYFVGTVTQSLSSIRSNMKLIEQVPIPKFLFVLSIAVSNIVNFLLSLVPLFLVMMVVGRPVQWTVLLFPIMFIPLFLITVGFSLLFAVANVFFEDTTHLVRVITHAWYYLTPILYGRDHIPKSLESWIGYANPMFLVCEYMRDIFYYGNIPSLSAYLYSCCVGLAVLALALWIFHRCDDKFIYFV